MPIITARHWLLLLFLILSWSSAIILTRVAVLEIPPLWVTAGRLTGGAIILIIYRLFFYKKPWSLGWHHTLWLILLGLLSSAAPFLLIAWGTQFTTSSVAGILMGTVPLIVLGLAHLLLPDEKMTRIKLGGFTLGFIGVILVINPWRTTETSSSNSATDTMELIGQLAIFLAAFCYAASGVLTRRMPQADNIDKATVVVLIAALMLLIACWIFNPEISIETTPLHSWLILAYLGLVPTAIASIVLFILLQETSASFVTTSNYIIPVLTTLGGILFLGESLNNLAWIGFIIILTGLILSNRKGARQSPDASSTNHYASNQQG